MSECKIDEGAGTHYRQLRASTLIVEILCDIRDAIRENTKVLKEKGK